MRSVSHAIVMLLLAATVFFAACSERSPASPTPPATSVSRIIVAGTPPALGTSSQFTAIAVLPDGSSQTVTSQAVWRSSNPSVATVTRGGMVTAASGGTVEISATYGSTTGMLAFTASPAAGHTLRATVTDGQSSGTAITAATVTVRDASGVARSGVTDASGQFSMGGVTAGAAEVTVTAPGYIRAFRAITISGDLTLSFALQPATSCPLIGFDDLGPHGAAFTSSTACGFTISGTTMNWTVSTGYGRPAPFIQFVASGGSTVIGELVITAAGMPFRFSSVDLYSSTTPIPYVITGIANSVTVFTIRNTQPNTFGNFATIVNPEASRPVDALLIRLSNPAAACCSNPMGLDNIVLAR